jgi:hypothetical protein
MLKYLWYQWHKNYEKSYWFYTAEVDLFYSIIFGNKKGTQDDRKRNVDSTITKVA